jgi:hypothetical protein
MESKQTHKTRGNEMNYTDEKMIDMVDRFKKLCEIVELPSPEYGSTEYERKIEGWASRITDEFSMSVTKAANFCKLWETLLEIHNISSEMP